MGKFPPGPANFPLAGIIRQRNLLPFLQKLAKEYGDLAHFRVGRLHYYLVNTPEMVRQVLVADAGKFTKGPALRNARITLGDGLLTAEGDVHRRQRRLITPVFHPSRVVPYGGLFVRYAGERAGRWREGEVFDVREEMTSLTLEIVTKALFGGDLPAGELARTGEAMSVLVTMFDRARNPLAPILNKLPLPSNLRFLKALRYVEGQLRAFIERKRAGGIVEADDLLSLLLRARDEGEAGGREMTDKQLRDEAITLFTAGHETTANALIFTWYLLAQNPAAEAEFHRELEAVLGDREPGAGDLERLPYTRMVLAESMRLYPPAWVIARQALVDYEVGGYRAPAGSVLLMSQFLIHRDGRYWPEPMRFDPRRFEESAKGSRPRFAYFPFGSGPRSCIGEAFAWAEAGLILATIGRVWRLSLERRDAPLELHPTITLRPRDPLMMAVHRR